VPEVTQFSSAMSKVTTDRAYKRDGRGSILEFASSAESDRSLDHWSFESREIKRRRSATRTLHISSLFVLTNSSRKLRPDPSSPHFSAIYSPA